jgi:hypothetical protein
MRKHFGVTLGIGLALFLLVGSVATAATAVVVKVPFSFLVKDKELPAGRYELQEGGSDLGELTIKNLDTGDSVMALIMTRIADMGAKEPQAVFDTAEGKYYLSEIHIPGTDGIALVGAPGKHTHTKVTASTK